MRLIISGAAEDQWAYLEPATADEIAALERCAGEGESSIGRGDDTIRRLRVLAERLGYLLTEVHEPAPVRQIVVQRGHAGLVATLRALMQSTVPVIVDRRIGDRRMAKGTVPHDQRRHERRRSSSSGSWGALQFHVSKMARERS